MAREKVALVIVHFVESMGGIRAVQAFRRDECADATQTFKLQGLDPDATYEVVDLDVGTRRVQLDFQDTNARAQVVAQPRARRREWIAGPRAVVSRRSRSGRPWSASRCGTAVVVRSRRGTR